MMPFLTILRVVLSVIALAPMMCAAQGVDLFSSVPEARLSASAKQRVLEHISGGRFEQTRVVRVNWAAFDSLWMSIAAPDGEILQIRRTELQEHGRVKVWLGSIGDDGGRAVFSYSEGSISAKIVTPRGAYSLFALDGETHLLAKENPKRRPQPDHPKLPIGTGDKESSVKQPGSSARKGIRADDPPPVIDVMIAYTTGGLNNQAGSGHNGILLSAQTAIADLNTALANSQLVARARLVGVVHVPSFYESTDWAISYNALKNSSLVASKRTELGADVVFMILNMTSSSSTRDFLCGYAAVNASSSEAFGLIYSGFFGTAGDCFDHEFGHILGGHHDTATLEQNGESPAYSYGRAYVKKSLNPSKCFITILGYYQSCWTGATHQTLKINYFSNPDAAWSGDSTGSSNANNARVIRERSPAVANFRPTVVPIQVPPPGPGAGTPPPAPILIPSLIWKLTQPD